MKKFLLLAICFATVVSCNKEKENGRLDPNSMLALNPGVGVKSDNPDHLSAREIVEYTLMHASSTWGGGGFAYKQRDFANNRLLISSDQIIRADGSLDPFWIEGKDIVLERGIDCVLNKVYYYPNACFRLDKENKMVLVGWDIYAKEDILEDNPIFEQKEEFPYPDDFVPNEYEEDGGFRTKYLQYATKDTIAYIPNAILREAEKNIKEAYAKGDYETCYKLFDSALSFYPITGAEWRALKAQGIE